MRLIGFAMFFSLPLLAACSSAPTTLSTPEGQAWTVDSEISDFNRRITVYIDGEEAMSHRFVPMSAGSSAARAEFRDQELVLNCRRNPIVYGVNCVLRADGTLAAQFQHVF